MSASAWECSSRSSMPPSFATAAWSTSPTPATVRTSSSCCLLFAGGTAVTTDIPYLLHPALRHQLAPVVARGAQALQLPARLYYQPALSDRAARQAHTQPVRVARAAQQTAQDTGTFPSAAGGGCPTRRPEHRVERCRTARGDRLLRAAALASLAACLRFGDGRDQGDRGATSGRLDGHRLGAQSACRVDQGRSEPGTHRDAEPTNRPACARYGGDDVAGLARPGFAGVSTSQTQLQQRRNLLHARRRLRRSASSAASPIRCSS